MNAPEHRFVSSVVLAAAAVASAEEPQEHLPRAMFGCVGGYCFASLPDLLEPATHPHHRQFFHSLVFAGVVAYGLYRLSEWSPQSPGARVLRVVGLLASGGYLVHLALDATTKRSLPLLGRIR